MEGRTDAIAALLVEAEGAHGVYESTELNGVYDRDWPRWYATYAVDHGVGELLGREVDVDGLARLLATGFEEFEKMETSPTEPWSRYLGGRISETFGAGS